MDQSITQRAWSHLSTSKAYARTINGSAEVLLVRLYGGELRCTVSHRLLCYVRTFSPLTLREFLVEDVGIDVEGSKDEVDDTLAKYFANALASASFESEDAPTLQLKFNIGGQIVEHSMDHLEVAGGTMDLQVFRDWKALVTDHCGDNETDTAENTKRART